MKLICAHQGQIHAVSAASADEAAGRITPSGSAKRSFRTGLEAIDALLPPGMGLARGAIHEILTQPGEGTPLFFAMILAKAACWGEETAKTRRREEGREGTEEDRESKIEDGGWKMSADVPAQSSIRYPPSSSSLCASASPREPSPIRVHLRPSAVPSSSRPLRAFAPSRSLSSSSAIVWCDPKGELYPPALAGMGIPLEQLFLLQVATEADQVWAMAECLRCKGVGVVVAPAGKLSQIEARRLQLAAERGGGVGLLLRQIGAISTHYAAATRWLVRPTPGERTVQRWTIQLIHGHGGHLLGESAILEYCRETNTVRAAAKLADRSAPKKTGTDAAVVNPALRISA